MVMVEAQIEILQEAIRNLHNCASTWVEAVPIRDTLEGQTVWDGIVQIFDPHGHPIATRCYARSHETDEGKQRFVAVLHEGPVDSPEKAARAAIVHQVRSEG